MPDPRTTEDRLRAALRDEMDPVWTDVERAIWPDGPAHGHGSGVYAALKAHIIAALAVEPVPVPLDVERLDAAMAAAGVHVDVRLDPPPPRPLGCESCRPALDAIAAEYIAIATPPEPKP